MFVLVEKLDASDFVASNTAPGLSLDASLAALADEA